MVSQATGGSRRARKRQRKEPAAQTNKPEFWMLPAGTKQKILTTISSDVQAGVSYWRYTLIQVESCKKRRCLCLVLALWHGMVVVVAKATDSAGAGSWHCGHLFYF